MKRLRKFNPNKKIRYFMCGEYGDTTNRPHYHAILFGYNPTDKKKHSGKEDKILYTSEALSKYWGLGHVLIGNVTWQSAAYVARYVIKKVNGKKSKEHYKTLDPDTGEIFDRVPEYINMSNRPGIGHKFYETYTSDLYPSDFTVVQGKKRKIPSYYDRKLEQANSGLHEVIKTDRKQRAREPARRENSTPSRLAVREEIQKARLNQLKRKL